MTNILLYIAVVLIWGSSWIMVKFQLGVVPPEASILYRIGIAAMLMFGWAAVRRLPLRFSLQDHGVMALQGFLIFSTNFYLFYMAAAYLTTGLISVVFSTASAMTLLFISLLQRRPPPMRVLLGAALGILGIGIIFWPEVKGFSVQPGAGLGLLLSIGGTASFSLGSIVSARNHAAGLSVRTSTAWAMVYGVVFLFAYLVVNGQRFGFDPRLPYVASMLYLSIIASVAGFASYFALLGRIKPERATYATVLFPIVALTISTLFEGYHWTAVAFVGVLLTLAGNVFVLTKPPQKVSSR